MQSRRARLPELLDERPLSDLAGHPGLLVADPGGRPAADLVPPVGGEWLVLVGPEGGLDPGGTRAARARDPPRGRSRTCYGQ